MNKKGLSSLEVAAIVNELQSLVKGRISQVYHQEKKELLFQMHAPDEGKKLVKLVPGKYLCFTKKKEVPLKPSSFCMQLRKYLNNAFVKRIYQKDSERIVIFELERSKEKYLLILELYSKGNLILTDDKLMIIGALESQLWKERTVKVKMEYVFPLSSFDWKNINLSGLQKILKKSEKKNLATALAIEVGLGGLYAEEVCKLSAVDSQKLPPDADEKDIKQIVKTVKDLLKKIEKPQGCVYEEQITPFPLKGEKFSFETETYSEAVDTLNPFKTISPYERKIKTLEKTIREQKEALESHQNKIDLNAKKGELIYEKYTQLQKLLEIVKELRKTKEWKEVEKELKKEQKIKTVNLKTRKIILDL
ncbi:MAG: NFACT family protein [Nanoarchaeota archaeon]|nr:NFACT family protein [Nanoarchaeota archaeon]MBU1644531.1 NFACT family protein [Nanoarchaeota archaeon]MBU1977117.1 NFACT family protein [Nanoarchaeota archaeon]